MILESITNSPTPIYAIISIASLIVGFFSTYLVKRSDNSTKIEIAELNMSEKEKEKLADDLKEAINTIKTLQVSLDGKDAELNTIKSDFKAVKVAFRMMAVGYEKIFKDDPDSLVMLSEMRKILNKENA